MVKTHLPQIFKGLFLMIHQFKGFPQLSRKGILNIPEHGRLAEERHQFILHALRGLFDLRGGPAIDPPSIKNHAVLLEQVIVILFLGDFPRLMPGIAVHLHGDPAIRQTDGEVDGPVPAVDVDERILQVDILALVSAEGLTEQFNKPILRPAVSAAFSDCAHVSPHSQMTSISFGLPAPPHFRCSCLTGRDAAGRLPEVKCTRMQ